MKYANVIVIIVDNLFTLYIDFESQLMSLNKLLAQLYHEGDFIDAKDSQADWRVGYILQKNIPAQLFTVRFDGWGSKYDEHYKFTSPKLKPFRTYVIGYTGQQKNPGIRESWHFSVQNLQQRSRQIEFFINNPLKSSAHEINQLIRGQNYMFCDFLMTNTYKDIVTFGKVAEYFLLNIELLLNFLAKVSSNLEQFLKIIQIRKEPQQAISIQTYYLSFYEMFDTLYIIFGNYERLQCFFKNNQELIRQHFRISPNKDHKRGFKNQITKIFINLKGIEMIQQLLQKLTKTQAFIPFLFLSAFSHLIVGIVSICVANFRETLLEKLFKVGEQNVKKLKQHQLKQLHRKEVSTFIQELSIFARGTKFQDSIEQWGLFLQLNLSLKMIMCPYFERKLKGIIHISEVCEKHQDFISKDNKFRTWIQENSLFKNLFIINDNLQIIKKSCDLTRFLVIRKLLKPEDIDVIWNSRVAKHQTVIKQIYTLISQLPYYQKDEVQNVKLFNKISNIPPEKWDEDFIHMIRVFSTYAYGENKRQNPKQVLGFTIVSEYAIKKTSEFAINQLVALFEFIEDSPYLAKFQEQCLLQIKNRNNIKNNIKILFHLTKLTAENFKKMQVDSISIIQQFLEDNPNNQDATMIEQAFKLLQSLIKSISNYAQVTTVTHLWFKFIHSSNRKALLNWMLVSDQKNMSLSPIFKKTRLAELLLKILWKNDENKKMMDEAEVNFIIELITQANIENNIAKVAKITNKLLPQELHGYQLLFLALKLITDANAGNKICEFIAYLHVNVNEALLQTGISSLSQAILHGIREAQTSNNKMYLGRILMLMKKTLDYDDQQYPSKPNTKHHYAKEYTIYRKDTKESIAIKFNCLGYFYEFKKMVSSKLNLPLNKFDLFSLKGIRLGRQYFNKTMIDQVFTGSKFQAILKQQHSLVKAIFNENIDVLFNLLDDTTFQIILWNIVERLPLSEDLKSKITKSQNIFDQLEQLGFYKQLYMLKIMQELEEQEWLKLAKAEKLKSLLKYLKNISFVNQIEEQFVITITNIIMKIITSSKLIPQFSIQNELLSSLFETLSGLFESIQKSGCKNVEFQQKIIKNIFNTTSALPKLQNVVEKLMKYEKITFLLHSGLITIPQKQIRTQFAIELKLFIRNFDFQTDTTLIALLLGKLFNLATNQKKKQKLKQYYSFTSYALSKCSISVIDSVYEKEANGLVFKLFDLLKREKAEQSNECQNRGMEGYLILLKHLVKVQKEELQTQLLEYIVYECLFSQKEAKCKSSPSRRQAFAVLLQLSQNEKKMNPVINYLISLHKKGKWRSRRHEDWGITFNDKMKSSTGFVGLKNLGCICYMNSFIQQLFMIPYFRYSITNAVDTSSKPSKPEQNVLYQLQKMFMNLEYSDKKFYNPKQFCFAFKDYEGNPTNVAEQMDIDEFSNILFDRVQNLLKQSQYPTLIKDMFGGVFSNEIVCKGCPHYSQSEEPFLSISLTVKGQKNINNSFENMIKGDTLDGDNAYYCERCNKKVNAIKRMSLKKLPNHLIITLKRFQFDYEKMIKLKVNDLFEFPHNLNLKEYSRQFLRKQQGSKMIEEEEQFDNSYYNYVLKGFVIHIGHADSGHYYSIIQDRWTGKWYEFNDSLVRDFGIEEMPEQAFGGEMGISDVRQKIKNAYMVIYERQKKIPMGNEISWKRQQIKNKAENRQIVRQIMKENNEHKLQNILFSKQYTRYLTDLLSRSQKLDYSLQKSILKFATIHYLTVIVRQKGEEANPFIIRRISRNIEKHRDLALWIVNLLSIDKVYDQFFINNPSREIKKTLSHWLVYLIKLCQYQNKQTFLNSCVNKIVVKGQNSYQLCLILYQLLKSDNKLLNYALTTNLIGKLMQNIVRQKKDKKLLPQVQGESQIDYETLVPMGLPQQLRLKKMRLLQNENENIWAIINLFVRNSLDKGQQLRSVIPEQQWKLVFLNEAKIYKMLEQLKNKFAIYQFTYFISYLTKNNKEFLSSIIDMIFTGLRDLQSKNYRQFMLLFQQLITIKDDSANQKEQLRQMRLACFQKIIQALKHNEQYSLDSNIIQQWIVILLNRNQNLRTYLFSQLQTLAYLLNLSTKKVPSDEISKKNKKYTETMVNKLHGVMFLHSKKAYLKQAQRIHQFYTMIAQNKFVESPLWPKTADNYLEKRSINDKLAFFDEADTLEYQEVVVANLFLGKIELTQGNNKPSSIWQDDERLINEKPPIQQMQQVSESSQKLTEEMSEEEATLIDDS